MLMKKWEDLPREMQNEDVRRYYDILRKRSVSLWFKRLFDIVLAFVLIVLFSPVFLICGVAIKLESPGPVFFRQVRVTTNGRTFRIWKFRTMVNGADKIGKQLTTSNDARVTRVGKLIRDKRIDEIPQLFNVLVGEMSFVGTRPEVPRYVEEYTDLMRATLLLPAGITGEACIRYRNESVLLENAENAAEVYIYEVLPAKMYYNLEDIEKYSFWRDIKTMFLTVAAVLDRKNRQDATVEDDAAHRVPAPERKQKAEKDC